MDKILIVASIQKHIELFHIPYIKELVGKGYEVHVAAKLDINEPQMESIPIIWHNIDFSRSPFTIASVRAYFQLMRLIRAYRFSLLHVHTPVPAFLGRLAARMTGTRPVLYTAHGFHFYCGAPWRNWLMYFAAERLVAQWTDGLIVINQEDYKNAQKWLGFKPGKNLYYIKGVGVNLDSYSDVRRGQEFRKEIGVDDSAIVVVCVAELNDNKNQLFLLEAWAKVAKKIDNIHLALVGAGPLKQRLTNYILENAIERAYLLGYREDIPQILINSDVAVLVSKREGLPKFVMEAMAAGLPVIGTNTRGIRDLIIPERTGFLVDIDNVGDLAKKLQILCENELLRREMGEEARRLISEYSTEKIIPQMLEVFQSQISLDNSRYLSKGSREASI